jgi:hypothetical protein
MAFPATYNFSYYRGDSFEFVVQPKNADGSAFDLSTYASASATFTIASRSGGTDTFVFNGDIEVNSVSSYVSCAISPEDGETLEQGTTYVYDVEIKNDDNVFTLLAGAITVTNDVSGRVT